ncbi:hypothetical protein E3P99_02424 [Wallemia hederae]|uniref:SGS domain-containing protein n=1 Tax=Wallemia hederae TaxID=1540922 RepID=A0A4T0FMN4_9BASI|nr:hypothetical protein E3P99_02424 [Wallemia hederae]
MKMEFELVKADKGVTWGGIVAEAEPAQSTQSTRKQTKDWNKIASIEAQDKEEQGDGNPDDFFKKLFAGADDDVRKAMMKSYQESGGTSLSTNWEEVSKGKVESKPPAGIEKKEW